MIFLGIFIISLGYSQFASAAVTGTVSLDRTVYPVPWGELDDFGGTDIGQASIFRLHGTATGGLVDTDEETIKNGDLMIHVRINDADFDLDNSNTDTIAQNVNGTAVGPLKIIVKRDSNTMVLAYAGGTTTNTIGQIDVNDDTEKIAAIRQLGPISEIAPDAGIFELDFVIRYTDGPADFQCPATVSFVGTDGTRSADEFSRFDDSSGGDDFCILRGDTIIVEYTDPSDVFNSQNIEKDAATFDMRVGVLQTDKPQYFSGDSMILTLIEPDFDLDNDIAETYDLDLIEWSSISATITMGDLGKNSKSFEPKPAVFRETGDSTGIFQTVIKIPSELSGKSIGSETVTLEFADWASPASEFVGDEDWDIPLTIDVNPGLIRIGEIAEIQGKTVPIINQNSGVIKLPQNVDGYFPQSNQIRDKIMTTNFEIQPTFDDKFIEYDKKIVLKKSTEITISNNLEFVSVFGKNSKIIESMPIKKNDQVIGSINDNVVNNQIRSFIDNCTEDDPRAFCYMSEEELKNNILNKLGVHTISEKFVINKEVDKKSAHLENPKNGFFKQDYRYDTNNNAYYFTSGFPNYEISNSILPTADAQQTTLNGNSESKFKFLNGFTLGHGYSWGLERDWEYNDMVVFDSEVSAFVGLGIGLRIPGVATITAPTQNSGEFESSIELLNANPDEYLDRGIDSSQVFSGEEFVLEIGPEVTGNVNFLGIPIQEFSLQETLFGQQLPSGSHFDPPLGVNDDPEEFFSEELPCNLSSYLCHEYGFVSASLKPGLQGDISGNELKINLTHVQSRESKPLRFFSETSIQQSVDSSQRTYEIKLDDVIYDSKLTLTPFVHGFIDLGMFSFLPVIGQGLDVKVDLYEIEFDHIILKKHDDTHGTHTISIHDGRESTGPTDIQDIGLVLDEIVVDNGSTMFEITGTTDRVNEVITVTVTSPNGNIVSIDQIVASHDGKIATEITVGGILWKQDGIYTVNVQQSGNPQYFDSKQIEIKDGVVVPEFGIMASFVLVIAMATILGILLTKKNLGLSFNQLK